MLRDRTLHKNYMWHTGDQDPSQEQLLCEYLLLGTTGVDADSIRVLCGRIESFPPVVAAMTLVIQLALATLCLWDTLNI